MPSPLWSVRTMLSELLHYTVSTASRQGLVAPFDGISGANLLLLLWIINGFLAIIVAGPLTTLLPPSYRQQHATWFFGILCAGIPLFGLLASLIIAGGLSRLVRLHMTPDPEIIHIPPFTIEMRGRNPHMGAGGAWAILRAPASSPNRSVRALLSLDPRLSRQTAPLIREALRHPYEDLRLLAYGLLDQREGDILELINQQIKSNAGIDDTEIAQTNKRIALLYWELLYQDLSRDHLRQYATSESRRYAQLAIKTLDHDALLHVLLGRLCLLEGDCLQACMHLEQALQLHTTPAQVLPYLAEARFRLRDMANLHTLTEQFSGLLDLPNIGPVARFWMAKNEP